ncbi:MAG: molybdopterin biosynthesis protein [Rhodospirillaceae bacterium]
MNRSVNPFNAALAWLEAVPAAARHERIPVLESGGRVLAAPVLAPRDQPAVDRALLDGYAVHAAETVGAGAYNPLLPASAVAVAAGDRLPPGTDAVASCDMVSCDAGFPEFTVPIAPGEGVDRAGRRLRHGVAALEVGGHPVRPEQLALLIELGITTVTVFAHPRVALSVSSPRPPDGADTVTPMLQALIARDGGAIDTRAPDLIITAGGSFPPPLPASADFIPELYGFALRPGGSAGLGRRDGVPVILLPGEPLACLTAYDLLAARLIRRRSGLVGALPYPTVSLPAGRKFVSRIGSTDIVRVRLGPGRVEPLGPLEGGGLALAARADGFVIIPAAREGYAPGESVTVYHHGAVVHERG